MKKALAGLFKLSKKDFAQKLYPTEKFAEMGSSLVSMLWPVEKCAVVLSKVFAAEASTNQLLFTA